MMLGSYAHARPLGRRVCNASDACWVRLCAGICSALSWRSWGWVALARGWLSSPRPLAPRSSTLVAPHHHCHRRGFAHFHPNHPARGVCACSLLSSVRTESCEQTSTAPWISKRSTTSGTPLPSSTLRECASN
jgi:hypothetical protein